MQRKVNRLACQHHMQSQGPGNGMDIARPQVVSQHKVKVYAPGAPGAPPMSMPHLDYRTIGGKDRLPLQSTQHRYFK